MSERFNLQKMLLEIQEDEAGDNGKTPQLSQDQIRELVTRRKAHETEKDVKPTNAQ